MATFLPATHLQKFYEKEGENRLFEQHRAARTKNVILIFFALQ